MLRVAARARPRVVCARQGMPGAAVCAVPSRGLAKKGGGGKKKGAAAPKVALVKRKEGDPVDMAFLSVFKTQELPEVKEDSEYPEWLFDLDGIVPTFTELKNRIDEFDEWPSAWQQRFVKTVQRAQIKAKNEENRSG